MEEEENGTAEVVRWERYLPKMVLRVLLVEPDDSTRQVISALLRKCSYKVTSVSDGLEAWTILKEKLESVDLILTEVELPSVSGFTLLTLVMDHDVCRKIPVIMMSSQDSFSTVLKCMLKGAADFLIKPIRKNELKNLWQHVWRKQMSTAEIKSPSTGEEHKQASSETMAASSPSNDYVSSEKEDVERGQTNIVTKDFSQMECENPVGISKITTKLEEECVRLAKDSNHGSKLEEKFQLETLCKGKSDSTMLKVSDDSNSVKRSKQDNPEGAKVRRGDRNGAIELHRSGNLHLESPSLAAVDLIGSFGSGKRKHEVYNSTYGKSGSACDPQLELTLQWSDQSGPGSNKPDEGCLLNHSSASAFSRYNPCNRFRPSLRASFLINSKAQGTVNESNQFHQSHLGISGSNNGDSSTAVISEQSEKVENASASSFSWGAHITHKPDQSVIQRSHSGSSKLQKGVRADDVNAQMSIGVRVGEKKSHKEDCTQFVAFGPCSPALCRSNISYICKDVKDGNERARNDNWDNDSGIASATAHNSGIDLPLGSGPNRLNSIHLSERQAALIKFREKRNKRCFDKKVRYHSRKHLAEQRPRVKGQFVCQNHTDSASSAS